MTSEGMEGRTDGEQGDVETGGGAVRVDEALLPRPSFRERARDYRETFTWRHALVVAGGVVAAVGGVLLVRKVRG